MQFLAIARGKAETLNSIHTPDWKDYLQLAQTTGKSH